MADFCFQCTRDLDIAGNLNDMAGLVSKSQVKQGLYASVLCEGCGSTYVDSIGRCVIKDCLKEHGDL